MDPEKIEELKNKLIQMLADEFDIQKFEIIFDFDSECYGIRHKYSDAESIANFEYRKAYLIKKAFDR